MREAGAPSSCVLAGMAAKIFAASASGIALSTRSPTAGWAARTTSAATRGPLAVRTSMADSVSSRLTSAASAAASRWCTADRGVASWTA